MRNVVIYSDGSCRNSDGNKGGWGVVLIRGEEIRQWCGGSYINTTSARMEILSVVRGLQKCEIGERIKVFSDNSYVVNSLEKGWIFKWAIGGWKSRKNKDLLQLLLGEYNRLERKVQLKWIKGHAGDPGNELADSLAERGANRKTIIKDKI